MLHKSIAFLLALFSFISCKEERKQPKTVNSHGTALTIKYAKGFTVMDYGDHKILEITKPWQDAEESFKYLLLFKSFEPKNWSNSFDGFIKTPIKNIVVTSTTHIPALELLGVENTLVGFPETNYISSQKTRRLIEEGNVVELGKNEGINTEVLLNLNPDLVVGFGINGTNKTFENIKKSGIPVIYNGDWMETSPLAKAEWIKFFGVLFNKETVADSIFNQIEINYLEAKKLAQKAKKQPTVLSGAMHKDIWYLPNGNSTEAEFLKDANVHYLWNDTDGSGSLALSFESVFDTAQNADIWLNPSNFATYDALEKANPHYTKFKAFTNKNIFTINNTKGDTGGVLYYESGMARPDWVLKDLIKICHPDILPDYEPYFFKPLK